METKADYLAPAVESPMAKEVLKTVATLRQEFLQEEQANNSLVLAAVDRLQTVAATFEMDGKTWRMYTAGEVIHLKGIPFRVLRVNASNLVLQPLTTYRSDRAARFAAEVPHE